MSINYLVYPTPHRCLLSKIVAGLLQNGAVGRFTSPNYSRYSKENHQCFATHTNLDHRIMLKALFSLRFMLFL